MGIIFLKKIDEHTFISVWEVIESYKELLYQVNLTEQNVLDLLNFKNENRKKQYVAARILLNTLLSKYTEIAYDEYGKPFIPNSSHKISISHSGNYIAIIVSSSCEVGIDIEVIRPKIEKIASKFIHETEFEEINIVDKIEHLHVIWGAKESLYKLYGKGELDFKKHLLIQPFNYLLQGGQFFSTINKGSSRRSYKTSYQKINNCMLVYVLDQF